MNSISTMTEILKRNYSEDAGCSHLQLGDIINDNQNIHNWNIFAH